MSCSCAQDPCTCHGQFTTLSPNAVAHTLAYDLIPVVDCARDLYTQLGTRTYEVALVKTQWSGGERGVGQESVVEEMMILPTPRVVDMTPVRKDAEPLGLIEAGQIRITEISPRFTEEQLTGRSEDGSALPDDRQFYWEIRFITPGQPSVRRRFALKTVPNLSLAKSFGWVADLVRAYDDRERFSGAPNG